jgi:hypothetical protein
MRSLLLTKWIKIVLPKALPDPSPREGKVNAAGRESIMIDTVKFPEKYDELILGFVCPDRTYSNGTAGATKTQK